MKTELELVETKTLDALVIFTNPDGLDKILKEIENKVSGIVPDISTQKGRKEIDRKSTRLNSSH